MTSTTTTMLKLTRLDRLPGGVPSLMFSQVPGVGPWLVYDERTTAAELGAMLKEVGGQ